MKSYCLTDVGVKRNMNQDFVYASDEPVGPLPNLYIVADGMGGHNAGDFASRCAVETMVGYIEHTPQQGAVPVLREAITRANSAILAQSLSDRSMEGMGTTVVAACVIGDSLYVANVGDSRLYVMDDRIEQITKDHSLVEEMVRLGTIRKEEARNHPEKNIITRAVGVRNSVKIEFFDVGLNPGDKVLLCSDGLTNMVEDRQILRLVDAQESLEEAVQTLVDTANKNGGNDNISVILLEPMAGEVS